MCMRSIPAKHPCCGQWVAGAVWLWARVRGIIGGMKSVLTLLETCAWR